MSLSNRAVVATMFAAALAVVSGCAGKQAGSGDVAIEGGKQAGPAEVAIELTDAGFVPAVANVPKGQAVTLVVTRKTDKTCVTEFVMDAKGIRRNLPLGQAVEITFTPERPGELRYACGMDMMTGQVVAR